MELTFPACRGLSSNRLKYSKRPPFVESSDVREKDGRQLEVRKSADILPNYLCPEWLYSFR
jgi:hypothetical protein